MAVLRSVILYPIIIILCGTHSQYIVSTTNLESESGCEVGSLLWNPVLCAVLYLVRIFFKTFSNLKSQNLILFLETKGEINNMQSWKKEKTLLMFFTLCSGLRTSKMHEDKDFLIPVTDVKWYYINIAISFTLTLVN